MGPSNKTEAAPAVANATAPAAPSNDTTKPGARDVIGIGQRLTSEQKDTPPEGSTEESGAAVKTPSAVGAIQSAADLMNYTASAILGQKDLTAKPASSGVSPGLYVSEPAKVEEVKIKTATEEKAKKTEEEEDDSEEKEEASETTKDESKEKSEEAQNQKKDVAVAPAGKINEKTVSTVASNKTAEESDDPEDSEEEGEEEGDDNGDDDDEGDDDAEGK